MSNNSQDERGWIVRPRVRGQHASTWTPGRAQQPVRSRRRMPGLMAGAMLVFALAALGSMSAAVAAQLIHVQNLLPGGYSATIDCHAPGAKVKFDELGEPIQEWHFIINGIEGDKPESITAVFTSGNVEIPVGPEGGAKAAHYTYVGNLTGTLTDAFTSIYDGWDGQFVLSHAPCSDKVDSTTTTDLHTANDVSVPINTSVPFGSFIHDSATVEGTGPVPTGTVTFNFFYNGTCAVEAANGSEPASPADAGTVLLDEDGVAEPSTAFGPLGAGFYSFQATYSGDSNYKPSTASCEPFRVRADPSPHVSIAVTAAGTYERHCTWDINKSVDKSNVVLGPNGEATLTYTIAWTKDCKDSNFLVSGEIKVTNAELSPDAFDISDVSDDLAALVDCNGAAPGNGLPIALAPGAELTCTFSLPVGSAAPGSVIASAVVDGATINSASAPYAFVLGSDTGETATFTDDLLDLDFKVSASGSLTEDNTYVVSHGGTCEQTKVENIAEIKWVDGSDSATATTTVDRLCLEMSKTARATWSRECTWDVNKSVDKESIVVVPGTSVELNYKVQVHVDCKDSPYNVSGTVTVTNTGSIAADLLVTDSLGDLDCGGVVALLPGQSVECTYSVNLLAKIDGVNYAKASLSAGGAIATDTAEAPFKWATNPHPAVDLCVNISDTNPLGPNTVLCEQNADAEGNFLFEYKVTVETDAASCEAQRVSNKVAIARIGDDEEVFVLDSDRADTTIDKLCLAIKKSATLDYTRTCEPSIDKSVDTESVILAPGQTAEIHWTVEATLDCDNTDGVVTGNIGVRNTGSVAASFTVSDVLGPVDCNGDEGGDGLPAVLQPGDTLTCTYSGAIDPIVAGINKATAKATAGGVSASADAQASYSVVAKPQGCYVAIDTNSILTVGICDDGTSTEPQTRSFEYDQTVGPYDAACIKRHLDNTAFLINVSEDVVDMDTASVDIEVPCITGFTVGFWGNQNGEALLQSMAHPVYLSWNGNLNLAVTYANGQLILPNNTNFCGLGLKNLANQAVSCAKSALDPGINANSVNNLAAQTLALTYNTAYRGPLFSAQTLDGMGCTIGAGLGSLTGASTIADALAYANHVLGNVAAGGTVITQVQVGAVNSLLGGCLNTHP